MTTALWIIAVVESFRAICQYKQLKLIESDTGSRDKAYEEFIKSLKQSDWTNAWRCEAKDALRVLEDTADTPQTDCDKCIWSVCNYNKVDWDTPQTEREGE